GRAPGAERPGQRALHRIACDLAERGDDGEGNPERGDGEHGMTGWQGGQGGGRRQRGQRGRRMTGLRARRKMDSRPCERGTTVSLWHQPGYISSATTM